MLKELPEKWCINRQDLPDVCDWFTEYRIKLGNSASKRDFRLMWLGWYTRNEPDSSNSFTSNVKPNGFTEINYKDFKRLVLKITKSQDIKTRIKNLKI